MRRTIAGIALVASAFAVGVGCGGSTKNAASTPAATAAQASGTASPSAPPLPTLADPAAIPLVPQSGNIYHYAMSLPAGWVRGDLQAGFETWWIPNPVGKDAAGNDLRAGYVGILCQPTTTHPGDFHQRAQASAKATSSAGLVAHVVGDIADTTVAGLSAATLHTIINFGVLSQRTYRFFIDTPDCAWEVNLSVLSPGDESPYWSLFDRIMETFLPNPRG